MARIISPITSADITSTTSTPVYGPLTGPDDDEGTTRQENGYADFTARMFLVLPSNGLPRRGVIITNGGGGNADNVTTKLSWGTLVTDLADMCGYAVLGVESGAASVGNPLAQAALTAAYDYLTNTVLGTPGAKVGVAGHSMAGFSTLNWSRVNASKVMGLGLLSPALDIDVGHTIGYNRGWNVDAGHANYSLFPGLETGVPNPTTKARPSYAYLVPTPDYLDGPDPYDTVAWQNNVRTPGWDKVNRSPSDWGGLFPIKIWTAEQDESVPYQMVEWWVDAVNSPDVTHAPIITRNGSHHHPGSYGTLASGDRAPSGLKDNTILASGGMPRYEWRDFFLMCESRLEE